MLLEHGADADIRNSQGETAYDLIVGDLECQLAFQEYLQRDLSRSQTMDVDLQRKVEGKKKGIETSFVGGRSTNSPTTVFLYVCILIQSQGMLVTYSI